MREKGGFIILKNRVLYFFILLITSFISFIFYHYISMDVINIFYNVVDYKGYLLYICHFIYFFLLIKILLNIKINKFDKMLFIIMYFMIAFIFLFDNENLYIRISNINPFNFKYISGFYQLIINFFIFIPLYTIQNLINKRTKLFYNFIGFLIFSFIIEIYQYITLKGIFDIVDILSYTFGYILGIMFYKFCFN